VRSKKALRNKKQNRKIEIKELLNEAEFEAGVKEKIEDIKKYRECSLKNLNEQIENTKHLLEVEEGFFLIGEMIAVDYPIYRKLTYEQQKLFVKFHLNILLEACTRIKDELIQKGKNEI
jgi:hypothetical protein